MSVEVVPVEQSLDDLAQTIREQHALVERSVSEALDRALVCGQALLDARKHWGRRPGWPRWVLGCGLDPRTASSYMRLARYREVIASAEVRTVGEASALLAHQPRALPPFAVPQSVRDDAVRLVTTEGVRITDAARLLGISQSAVREALEPGYGARTKERHEERAQRRRQERAAEEARLAKIAAGRAGAAAAEAYALAERLQDALGKAHSDAVDRQIRSDFAMAGIHYRKMRDAIVRAVLAADEVA